jgi:NAD(P)H dehydrogenase (quinone)
MILVTGAGGKTGWAVIRVLGRQPEPIRALIHRPGQAASVKSLGAHEVVVGDLLDRTGIRRAVDGVRAIYHMAPNVSPDEVSIGRNIIDAAQLAKVERFVFHSVLHPYIEAMPHHWQKARVEELIFASGLPFTILQPTAYMQNVVACWEEIIEQGRYPVPYSPDTRLSLVDLEDDAQAAAIVLTGAEQIGATIELVGTRPMTQIEIATELSRQLGRPVTAEQVPRQAWERRAQDGGLGEYQVMALSKMFDYYEQCGLAGNSQALRNLLGRQPASFADFIRRTALERGI